MGDQVGEDGESGWLLLSWKEEPSFVRITTDGLGFEPAFGMLTEEVVRCSLWLVTTMIVAGKGRFGEGERNDVCWCD